MTRLIHLRKALAGARSFSRTRIGDNSVPGRRTAGGAAQHNLHLDPQPKHQNQTPGSSRFFSVRSRLASKDDQQHENNGGGVGKIGAEVDPETDLDLPPSICGYNEQAFKGLYEHLEFSPTAPWGLAIYRTAYNDEAAWQLVLRALEADVTNSLNMFARRAPDRPNGLEFYHRDALLHRHEMVVFNDRTSLHGAEIRDIRTRFSRWASEELERNLAQAPGEDPSHERHIAETTGVRYEYCLVVDELCLEATNRAPHSPLVMLVRKAWDEDQDWDRGDDPHDENGGWMFRRASDYVSDCEELLISGEDWWQEGAYVPPPLTYHGDKIQTAPGHWRKNGWNKKDE